MPIIPGRSAQERGDAVMRGFEGQGVLGSGLQGVGTVSNVLYENAALGLGTRPKIKIEDDVPEVGELSEVAQVMVDQILGTKGEHWTETAGMMMDPSNPEASRRFGMLQDLVRNDPNWNEYRARVSDRIGSGPGADEAYWNEVGTAYLEKLKQSKARLDVSGQGAQVAIQAALSGLTGAKLLAGSAAAAFPTAAARARNVPLLGRLVPNVADDATAASAGEIARAMGRDVTGLEAVRLAQGGARTLVDLAGRHPRTAFAFGTPVAAGAVAGATGGDVGEAVVDTAQFTIPVALASGGARMAGFGTQIDDASAAVAGAFTKPRTLGRPVHGPRPDPQFYMDRAGAQIGLSTGAIPHSIDNVALARGLGNPGLPVSVNLAIAGAVLGGLKEGEAGMVAGAVGAPILGKALGNRAITLGNRQLLGTSVEVPVRAPALAGITAAAVSDAFGGEAGLNTFLGAVAAGAVGSPMGYRGLFASKNGLFASMFDEVSGDYRNAVARASSFLPQKMFRSNDAMARYFWPQVEEADLNVVRRMEELHERFTGALGENGWNRPFLRNLSRYMEQTPSQGPLPPSLASLTDSQVDTLRSLRLEMDAIVSDLRRMDPEVKYVDNYWPHRVDVEKVVYGDEASGWDGVPKALRRPQAAEKARLSLNALEAVDIGQVPTRTGNTAYNGARHMMILEPSRFFRELRAGNLPTSYDDALKMIDSNPEIAKRNFDLLEDLAKVSQGRAYMGTVLDITAPSKASARHGLFEVQIDEAALPEEVVNPFLKERKGGSLPLMDDPLEVLSMYITKYLQKKYYEPLLKPSQQYLQSREALTTAKKALDAAQRANDPKAIAAAQAQIAALRSQLTPEAMRGLEELDIALAGKPNAQEIVSKLMRVRLGHPDPVVEQIEQVLANRLHPVRARSAARTIASLQYMGGLGGSPMSAVRGLWQSLLGATAVTPRRMGMALRDVTANPELYERKLMRAGAWTSPVEEVFTRQKQHAANSPARMMYDETVQGSLALHQWADQRARMYSFAAYERWALESFEQIQRQGADHDIFRAFQDADRRSLAQRASSMSRQEFAEVMGKAGSDLTNWIYGVTGSPTATRGTGAAGMVFTTWPANYIGLMNQWMRDDMMAPRLLGMGLATAILDRVAYEGLGLTRFTGMTNEGSNWGSDSWLSTFPVQGGVMGLPPVPRAGLAAMGAVSSILADDTRSAQRATDDALRSTVGLVGRPASRALRMYSDGVDTKDKLGAIYSFSPAED